MNNRYLPYLKLFVSFTFILLTFVQLVKAQSSSSGNTFVSGGAELGIIGVQHNFQNGGSGVLPGIVGTERTAPQGFLSFSGTASSTGAADNAHVDGYVKTYMTTAFTFPIGDNGKYRPVAISAASLINPANAAYFGVSASTAVTTSIKGGNEPVLPTGGPFNTSSKGSGVSTVDNVEYWDINGAASARITLTWDATTAVSTLTNSTLSNLSILGWDGTKWVSIPSMVDATSLLGGSSSLTTGSITTTATIVPNTYTVYTLGGLVPPCLAGTTAPAITATTVANTCPATTFSLAALANTGTKPSGTTLVWSTRKVPTSAGDTLTNLTTVSTAGKYYALYYDKVNSCYSPADSVTATITVCLAINQPATQTGTVNTSKSGTVPADVTPTGGLGTITYTNGSTDPLCVQPVGATALPVASNLTISSTGAYSYTVPSAVGTYYFCVKVCDSTTPTPDCKIATYRVMATAVPCNAGTVAPTLTATTRSNVCPATTADLSLLVSSTCPVGSALEWHNTNTGLSAANKVANPASVLAGTYYPVCFDATNTCYSPTPTTGVTVTITACCKSGTIAPIITATTVTNTCPTTTFSLAGLANTGTKPAGTTLVWSTRKVPASVGDTLTNLTTVSTAGKYYAMYFDKVANCYSPADSVTATLTVCTVNPPAQSATNSQAKTGNASTELTPTGGTSPYIYSVDNSVACTPVVGATALPPMSNLTVTNASTGAYTYTAPATAGTYYYCIKVCDTSTPTPNCTTKTYTLTVTCPVGTAVPSLK